MKALIYLLAFGPLGAIAAQTGATKAEPPEEGFAPLAYFNANCARCHGPNGSFYGADFGKGLKDDAALKQIVKEMCEGPGQAPLDAAKLDILTDFHRALRDDLPFLVVVSQSATQLSGEASPDAIVTLENGDKAPVVKQNGNEWSVELPADFVIEGAKIAARRGGKVAEIDLKMIQSE